MTRPPPVFEGKKKPSVWFVQYIFITIHFYFIRTHSNDNILFLTKYYYYYHSADIYINMSIDGEEPLPENGRSGSVTDPDVMISSLAAFEAASRQVARRIETEGSIGALELMKTLHEKEKIVQLVHTHFPGSILARQVLERVQPKLLEYGCTSENTLFAPSVCPDQIKKPSSDLTKLFSSYFQDHTFSLSGLAGIPSCGKTGFRSFLSQCNGHGFVLLAPHIGIDDQNELGKYTSTTNNTTSGGNESEPCCHACVTALDYCLDGANPIPDLTTHFEDYQMNYIIQQIDRRKDLILMGSEEEREVNTIQADVVKMVHQIAKTTLDRMVNNQNGTTGNAATVVCFVLTGIVINMPAPFDDFFQPRFFYVMDHGKKKDLMRETFGNNDA